MNVIGTLEVDNAQAVPNTNCSDFLGFEAVIAVDDADSCTRDVRDAQVLRVDAAHLPRRVSKVAPSV